MRNRSIGLTFATLAALLSGCASTENTPTGPIVPGCGAIKVALPDSVTLLVGHRAPLALNLTCASQDSVSIVVGDSLIAGVTLGDSVVGVHGGITVIHATVDGVSDSLVVTVVGYPWRHLVDSVPLAGTPYGAATRPGTDEAFVTLYDRRRIAHLGLGSRTVETWPCCSDTTQLQLVFQPNGRYGWGASYDWHRTGMIDPEYPVGGGGYGQVVEFHGHALAVGINPAGTKLYAATDDDSLYVIALPADTVIRRRSIFGAGGPAAIAFSGDGTRLYVAGSVGSVELDAGADTVLRQVGGGMARAIALTSNETELVEAYAGAPRGIYFFNRVTNDFITYISTSGVPFDLVRTSDGGHLLASCLDGKILVIDTETRAVVDSFVVGGTPRRMALSRDGLTAIIANETGYVSFIR